MRIIAGSAGGIPLSVPGSITRPTMDKVRAAIFSSLGDAVLGARVVDLFAGSGSLGLEALSRGAASCTFVDENRQCADSIRRNLAKTRLEGSVQSMDAFRFVQTYAHAGSLDLVFADPPYTKEPGDADHAGRLLNLAELPAALASGGTLVMETLKGHDLPLGDASPWRLLRSRTYGESEIHYLTSAR